MALASQGLFQGSQDITMRYEEQKLQPNIASQELLFWHVPAGSVGEDQSFTGGAWQVSNSANDWTGNTFTIGVNGPQTDILVTAITWLLRRANTPGTITCEITTVDTSEQPTTVILATGTTDGDTLATDSSGTVRKVTFSSPVTLRAGVMYAIYCRATSADATNTFSVIWNTNTYGTGTTGAVGAQIISTSGASNFTKLSNAMSYSIFEVGPSDIALINLFGTLKQIPLLEVVANG